MKREVEIMLKLARELDIFCKQASLELKETKVENISPNVFSTPQLKSEQTPITPIVKRTKQTHNLGKGRNVLKHEDKFNSPYGGK